MGYHRAGFEILGVDINPQPHYPFPFVQMDAMDFLEAGFVAGDPLAFLRATFGAIHASPPCQKWTRSQRQRKNADAHLDLVTPLRPLLEATGLPYVIENVEYCDVLRDPILLCGSMFDMDIQNHRLFETNWLLRNHDWPCRHGIWGKHRFPGTPQGSGKNPGASVVNRMASGVTHELLASAMGIDWIPAPGKRPAKALSEAIPPAFTHYIGDQLMKHLGEVAA